MTTYTNYTYPPSATKCEHPQCLAEATVEIIHSSSYPMGGRVVAAACDDDRAGMLAAQREHFLRRGMTPDGWVWVRPLRADLGGFTIHSSVTDDGTLLVTVTAPEGQRMAVVRAGFVDATATVTIQSMGLD